jgi:hypothetical protein
MVAFLADDGQVKISLNTTRQKTRNLMAQPRTTSRSAVLACCQVS